MRNKIPEIIAKGIKLKINSNNELTANKLPNCFMIYSFKPIIRKILGVINGLVGDLITSPATTTQRIDQQQDQL